MNVCVATVNHLSGLDLFFYVYGQAMSAATLVALFVGMIYQTIKWTSEMDNVGNK